MQTETDADRVCELGMDTDKIKISGNLKFDADGLPAGSSATDYFRERFQLGTDPVILAASTHPPEEKIVLDSFKQIIKQTPQTRLIIAPRHPERFNEVASLIESHGFSYSRRSEAPSANDGNSKVVLLDSIGELQSVYSLATSVFVGGSLAKTGGHNILEPAAVGACVVTGAHTHNFQAIVDAFVKADAVVQLPPMPETAAAAELASQFSELLRDSNRRAEIGARAQRLMNENRGATKRTVKLLEPLLLKSETDHSRRDRRARTS